MHVKYSNILSTSGPPVSEFLRIVVRKQVGPVHRRRTVSSLTAENVTEPSCSVSGAMIHRLAAAAL